MALGERFDGFHRLLQVAFDLCGGLRSRVSNAKRMQRQRERLEMMPIRVLHRFPSPHFRLPRFHLGLGLWASALRVAAASVAFQHGLGLLEVFLGLPQPPPNGERLALDDVMHEVEEIRHTQAF